MAFIQNNNPFKKKNPLIVGGYQFLKAMLVPTKTAASHKYDLSKEEDLEKLEKEKIRNEKYKEENK